MLTCFFIGHRDTPSWVQERLEQTVAYLVRECWVRQFIVGGHGSFDTMAASVVRKAKQTWPEIYARRLLCYHPSNLPVPVPSGFDDFYYPEGLTGVPARYAIVKANRIMVDQSDYLVAYIVRHGGNASGIYTRAMRCSGNGEIKVMNLADCQSNTG